MLVYLRVGYPEVFNLNAKYLRRLAALMCVNNCFRS
jgi:hypothetical protein